MLARFLLMQKAMLAMDLSETDNASSNSCIEAHLLYKCMAFRYGGKEILKSHMICRLHQQQLVEVLTLAVAGTWIMSRLYSFTILIRNSGIYMRVVKRVQKTIAFAKFRCHSAGCDVAGGAGVLQ